MSKVRPAIHRPKPIKPFSNVTRTQSSTLLTQASDLSFGNLGMRSISSINLPEFPANSPSLRHLSKIPSCAHPSMETLLQLETELHSLSLNTVSANATTPLRPSNPMVSDELWNGDCSFSTEGEATEESGRCGKNAGGDESVEFLGVCS
eukprot:TRINITY_DN1057_c0_g1_i24.p1 TRINITY_DN1057_c0_g1~~TRINITY_DN1057_c0_g1_i24.p1  ORF type:complete len:149 (-),score=6.30 TRINITY_DN1057_c0_g1_i24:133-579(-)